MWLPVLQLSKAEDAYAPRGVTVGSRFQSPSLGPSGVRNKMANNYRFLKDCLQSVEEDELYEEMKDARRQHSQFTTWYCLFSLDWSAEFKVQIYIIPT